ncbi:MAG: hypothetical protein KDK61_05635, partial [Simkania sp.]|nr:hypothetical protein [Simkania sp.]
PQRVSYFSAKKIPKDQEETLFLSQHNKEKALEYTRTLSQDFFRILEDEVWKRRKGRTLIAILEKGNQEIKLNGERLNIQNPQVYFIQELE